MSLTTACYQNARWYEGNAQSYVEDLKRRTGADAGQPHRVQYKKLVGA
jgi:hypothetical protein